MINRVVTLMTLAWLALVASAATAGDPIRVAATVPELGSLAREIGGDEVSVTVFAKPTEDPHFVTAKPSYIKLLSEADLYLQVGMEMEVGWAPVLLENARNGRVLPGAPGYVDASVAIAPLEVPNIPVDRSMGDVHSLGNPHYLLDPVEGLKVAVLIRDKLIGLRPAKRAYFETRYSRFAEHLAEALVGPALVEKYGVDGAQKLARLHRTGKLRAFLERQGEASALDGWLGLMLPYAGTKVIGDHNLWPYFANTFGLDIVGHMEPKPGVPPSTRHLKKLIERMRVDNVRVILTSAYYDPRHARFVSDNTEAAVLPMAHQAGAQAGTGDYLSMIDYNVRQVAAALESRS